MKKNAQKMLVIAPHPDDEVLGAGGTMANFAALGGNVFVLTVAAHMPPEYSTEVHQLTVREARKAHSLLGVRESIFLDIPALHIGEYGSAKLNNLLLEHINRIQPEIVLVPFYDRHIDHRQVFEAAMVATRPVGAGGRSIRTIATYETISETHWNAPHLEPNFTPNWFVDITSKIDTKLEAMSCYQSQLQSFPEPRSLDALKALAMLRGSIIGCGYGESFQILRSTGIPGMNM